MTLAFTWPRLPLSVRRGALALLSGVLLLGCSTRIIYYWLDTAIIWQLDDYFDLTSAQKNLLDAEVKGLMAWHREHEVARYAKDLQRLAKAVTSPMSPAQVDEHLTAAQASLTRTLQHSVPRAVRIAASLSDAQVTKFMHDRTERLRGRQVDLAQEDRRKVEAEFAQKLEKRLTYWLGEVKPAQAPLIAQWARWQYELMAPWLQFQHEWTRELARLMAKRQDPQFARELSQLLAQGDGLMDGRFTGYSQQSRRRTLNWLSALSQSLDLRQRTHLYGLLKGFASDFTHMAPANKDRRGSANEEAMPLPLP
ncbi:MAG: DUF6279 family lipoprotein [Aeromonas sp.]